MASKGQISSSLVDVVEAADPTDGFVGGGGSHQKPEQGGLRHHGSAPAVVQSLSQLDFPMNYLL